MLGEPYDALIIGSALTLVTSVVILIITNRAAENQWNRQRTVEEEAKAVEQVYSPLYFIFWDSFYHSGYLDGLLTVYLQRDISKNSTQEDFLDWIEEYKNEHSVSTMIKEILISKLGLIYPLELRDDLFYFYQFLESFERDLSSTTSYDFRKENIVNFQKKLEVYNMMAMYSTGISIVLVSSLKKRIDQKGKIMLESDYSKVFDIKDATKLHEFLSQPASDELLADFKKFLAAKISKHK